MLDLKFAKEHNDFGKCAYNDIPSNAYLAEMKNGWPNIKKCVIFVSEGEANYEAIGFVDALDECDGRRAAYVGMSTGVFCRLAPRKSQSSM